MAGARQLGDIVREMLAAGRPQLPRSVRQELARLLLADDPDRAARARTAPLRGEGSS
ncbi:MAG: hypothetical protein ABIP94_21130 [Planctomycetota bacterium]